MSATLEFLNALSAAGLMAVLNTLWQALAVAAVMWFILRLMPRVNAATRHAVWWAVLALVVLMPLTVLLSRRAPVPSPAVRTEKQIRTRALPTSAAKPLAVSRAYAPAPPLASASLPALNSRPAAAPRVRIPIEFHLGNWPSSLLFLWIAACCVLLSRIVHGYLRLRGVRKRARPASSDLAVRFEQRLRDSRTARAPQLLVSDEVISPLAAGFLHPVVILPQTLLAEIAEPELDCVLLHELATSPAATIGPTCWVDWHQPFLSSIPWQCGFCAASSERGRSPVTIGLSPPPAPPFTTPSLSGTLLNSAQRAAANC